MKKYLLALLMLCPLLFVQNASAKIKIYVQADTAPYLYAWNGGDEVNGGWPGTVMTQKETVNELEFWVKEFDLEAVNIIFNNGSGSQTADITGITSDAYFTYNGATVYENITAQITGQEETHTWGVVGEFTDWNTDVAMTPGEEEGTWTATINNVVVTADKLVYEYKVRADGKWDLNCGKEGKNSANNAECVFPKAGTYNVTISFNANFYDVSASYEEVGGDDPQLTTYTIILNTNRQLPTDDAGDLAYAYVWTPGDVFVEQLGEWPGTRMTNNGPTTYNGQNGTSYVITFDAAVAPEMVIFHDNNGNQTDDFSLVFDESNIAQFYMFEEEEEQPETYAIVGDFWTVMDGETIVTNGWEDDHQMTVDPENDAVYTLVVEGYVVPQPRTYAYRLRANNKWHVYDLPFEENAYYTFNEEGTYTLTFTADVKGHEISLTAVKQTGEPQTYEAVFVNGAEWEDVYAYAWTKGEVLLGEWPGTQLEKIDLEPKAPHRAPAQYDQYKVTITTTAAPEDIMIIFNNGKEGDDLDQTEDLQFIEHNVYTEKVPDQPHDAVYTVAGEPASLFGTAWDAENTVNDMTWNDEVGAYTLTYSDVTVELGGIKDIEFKVVKDHDWAVASYPEEKNYQTSLIGGFTYNITFVFYPETNEVTCWVTKTDAVITADDVFTVAGSQEILGSNWAQEDTNNDMTFNSETGLYELVKQNVDLLEADEEDDANPYQFKVVADHNWDKNWGAHGYDSDNKKIAVSEAGTYDITFTFDAENKVVDYYLTPSAEPEDVYTVAGAPESLFGAYWDPSQNVMTEEDGVYTWTATNVVLKKDVQYEYKVVKNGNEWLGPEGINNGDNYRFTIPTTGLYNVTFTLTLGDQDYTITEYPELISDEAHSMFFVNLAGWDHVYAYGFHYNDDNLVEFNGAWPGEECTESLVEYPTDSWGTLPTVFITYYGDHVPEFVVFSDGYDAQTVDIPFTENFIPYAYEAEDGSTIILMTTAAKLGLSADFVVPENVKVSLGRNFTVGQKCTVVLPFDLTAEQAAAAGTFYTPMEPSGDKLCFYTTTDIKAYTPYMFEPAVETPFKGLDVTVLPAEAKNEVVLGDKGFFTFEFHGTTVNSDTDTEWAYFGWKVENGEFFKAAPGEVRPYRAFLKLKQDVVPQYSKLFAVFGDATGISAIDKLTNEGAVIYDLQGRRVQNLTRGLYIVNGKKVILK